MIERTDRTTIPIFVTQFPPKKQIDLYYGDEISISIIGFHRDRFTLSTGKQIYVPFDFGTFTDLRAEFTSFCKKQRVGKSKYFLTGQTDDAIQYDEDHNHQTPWAQFPMETKDELHFIDPSYNLLKDYKGDRIALDIKGNAGKSVHTIVRLVLNIKKQSIRI